MHMRKKPLWDVLCVGCCVCCAYRVFVVDMNMLCTLYVVLLCMLCVCGMFIPIGTIRRTTAHIHFGQTLLKEPRLTLVTLALHCRFGSTVACPQQVHVFEHLVPSSWY